MLWEQKTYPFDSESLERTEEMWGPTRPRRDTDTKTPGSIGASGTSTVLSGLLVTPVSTPVESPNTPLYDVQNTIGDSLRVGWKRQGK